MLQKSQINEYSDCSECVLMSCPSNLVVVACPSFQFKNEKIPFPKFRNNSKESTLMRILEGEKKNFRKASYESYPQKLL